MVRSHRLGLLVAALAILALAALGAQWMGLFAQRPGAEENPAATAAKGEPGILRFPSGSPKLASIKVQAVEEFPVPLAEPQQAAIRTNLTRRYGEGLIFAFTQNPELIGGLRVQVGSDVFDGSVQARLAGLEATL